MNYQLRRLCQVLEGRIAHGRVIPFLGAGASLVGRPATEDWRRDGLMPSGRELAELLAKACAYPARERNRGLERVAQYLALVLGEEALYDELHATFAGPPAPTVVHRFLAERAAAQRTAGEPNPWPMIITTNYDDALEQAFADVDEPFDLVTYVPERDGPGSFRHRTPDGEETRIVRPNTYRRFAPERRAVIVKLHGGIDRGAEGADSFVITEDQYLSYLANDAADGLPACLLRTLQRCHLLFLGYALEDWNLRVFLFRLWSQRRRSAQSWAIQRTVNTIDGSFWRSHEVTVHRYDLRAWVEAMEVYVA